jgi:hypothetical protein
VRSVEPPSLSLREALLRAGLKTVDELHQTPLQPGTRGTLNRLCEMIWLRGIAGDPSPGDPAADRTAVVIDSEVPRRAADDGPEPRPPTVS